MPRAAAVLLAATVTLALFAASAAAQSQTVRGTGNITKLVADNGRSAVTVKLFGLAKACEAKQLDASIFWGKQDYKVEGVCIQGKWFAGLYYNSDRSSGSGGKKVNCRGFSLKYTAASKSWKAVVPRSCMSKAPSRVRVQAEGVDFTSAMPGEAGPTKLLRRG